MNAERYYAHSDPEGRGPEDGGRWHGLRDHLIKTAERARGFGEAFGAGEWAYVAGLTHDLGKYGDQFQRRLLNRGEKARDHSTAGVAALLGCYKTLGEMAALAVDGHHIGLRQIKDYQNWLEEIRSDVRHELKKDQFTERDFALLLNRFKQDGLSMSKMEAEENCDLLHQSNTAAAAMLDVRMLFSALVDADFLNTEAHFNGTDEQPLRYRPVGPGLDCEKSIRRLEEYVAKLGRENDSSQDIHSMRSILKKECLAAAGQETGLFTLNSPTGSGKTLAMLNFALHHAKRNNLRRIVLVMPYLNIIEQTLGVYAELFNEQTGFPAGYVLEDHSLAHQDFDDSQADHEKEELRIRRLLAENWDAPIILTTTVKCLESMMANRSGACRKLHRLAGSVILFDEVQTLPPRLVVPTLATLSRLADPDEPYQSTVVFSTATQPAFDHLNGYVAQYNPAGWKPTEIVKSTETLYQKAAHRVKVCWRHEQPVEKEELLKEIISFEQVMCIVNLKRHAKELAESLNYTTDGHYHLSTNMCPAHRIEVLKEVSERLKTSQPVRLIATQCVEAGVDVDFPVVYRALAPMESLAQAAGRCNRHGNRPQTGQVIIFRFTTDGKAEYPPGYGEGIDATGIFLKGLSGNLDDIEIFNNPKLLSQYYKQFYDLTGRGDGNKKDEKELVNAMIGGDFERVALEYRLIKQNAINILVPWNQDIFDDLVKQMGPERPRDLEMVRNWITQARPYTVGIHRPKSGDPAWNLLEPIQFSRNERLDNYEADWFKLLQPDKYKDLIGLNMEEQWLI